MSKRSYEEFIEQTLMSIELCATAQLHRPALVLLYSGIDVMAWLNRSQSNADAKRIDFLRWVEDYIVSGRSYPFTALELYGARCALLHSASAESNLSRIGKARMLFYAWGNRNEQELQSMIELVGVSVVPIQFEQLFDAFKAGLDSYKVLLSQDKIKAKLVYDCADKLLVNFRD